MYTAALALAAKASRENMHYILYRYDPFSVCRSAASEETLCGETHLGFRGKAIDTTLRARLQ
jgi:hypothetical protein